MNFCIFFNTATSPNRDESADADEARFCFGMERKMAFARCEHAPHIAYGRVIESIGIGNVNKTAACARSCALFEIGGRPKKSSHDGRETGSKHNQTNMALHGFIVAWVWRLLDTQELANKRASSAGASQSSIRHILSALYYNYSFCGYPCDFCHFFERHVGRSSQ